jgi:hypothetical protein
VRPQFLVSGAVAAILALLPLQPARADDLRGEIEAIVKDYLATHPDEVGEIAKNYMVKHPEAVGEILAEVLKRRSAAKSSAGTGAAPGASTPAARGAPPVDRSGAVASKSAARFY